ncbi:MAG: hypoxanthine phosphoribosyltransferase [Clostridiales bacterium]|jgi:hypoxanthine phosphoribosyltransferase|nr:hypoxanthine phosphoribosyltransferase [Clostridiales bacterium]
MTNGIERILVDRQTIAKLTENLGSRISEDYKDESLVVIGVLKGGFMFMADLIREISIPIEIDFIAVSSYGESTKSSGVVRLIKDVDIPLVGKNILLVEDIIDTGLTLKYLKEMFLTRNPLSVKVCAAFDKPERRRVDIKAEYAGIEIPNEYVVGYGLDYKGRMRNFKDLCVLDKSVL